MIKEAFEKMKRQLNTISLQTDFVIVGGGVSGVCAAIAAARAGIKVVLLQDRPVLGGNASSEVRLWILGATSHMGNNNRWSREGGIIDEILVENVYRNKEGNPLILDTIILEKVSNEPNIKLLLNTAVYDLQKLEENIISKVLAFCSQNETFYEVSGSLFCDASGDGILAYQAGAAFRMGSEDKLQYGEKFAPDTSEYGELLGHSIYFYSKDAGKPVKYIPPAYALKDITKIPRFGNINSGEHGCKFWWLEYGGRKDTVHDTEEIKWELWSIVYGVWNYIKNSGKYPDAENLTLEWVGLIPGKRESRRFEGLYTLTQQDIIEQYHFHDTVAYGGWAIDLHPAEGVYSQKSGCTQYHSKGIYEIPYRCYVSKDIQNMFYAGRNISTSHVAHGSSRVMATSAFGGQAVGTAAAYCIQESCSPAELLYNGHIKHLQNTLDLAGQSIPHTCISVNGNLAATARIDVSSCLKLAGMDFDGSWYPLDFSAAQLLPMSENIVYHFEVEANARKETELQVELRCSEKTFNYTPDVIIERLTIALHPGKQKIRIPFTKGLPCDQYGFVTFLKNKEVEIRMSNERYTGIVSVFNKFNYDVNNHGKQVPPENSGIDSFEFWCPERRPAGQNLAMNIYPAIDIFGEKNIINGFTRPTTTANAWVAGKNDENPELRLSWDALQEISHISLYFDTDFDHAMESVQMGHPENVMPFCVRKYYIKDRAGNILYKNGNNYQTINRIDFDRSIVTDGLFIVMDKPSEHLPAAIFQVVIR